MKWTEALALAAAAIIAAASLAAGIEGDAVGNDVLTVNKASGITSGVCVATGVQQQSLVQVQSNGVYYQFHSSSGWPLATTGALTGTVGDIIEVAFPAKFRVSPQSADARLSVTCFQR